MLAPTLTIHYSTELNAIQSPLFRLPAEIRNQLYTYIFNDTLYTLNLDKWRDDRTVNFLTNGPPPFYGYVDRVVLPFACRQLHHETPCFHTSSRRSTSAARTSACMVTVLEIS